MPLGYNSEIICPLSNDRNLFDDLFVYSRNCLLLFSREIAFYQKLEDWHSQKFQKFLSVMLFLFFFHQFENKSFGAVI